MTRVGRTGGGMPFAAAGLLAAASALLWASAPRLSADGEPPPVHDPRDDIVPGIGLGKDPRDTAPRTTGPRSGIVKPTIEVPGGPPAPRFKRPYEIWEKCKDRYGFGETPDSNVLPAVEKLDALNEKRKALALEYGKTKDNEAKTALKKEIEKADTDIALAELAPRGDTAEKRRAAFIEELLDALVLLVGDRDQGNLPDFQCSRPQVIADIEKILREIGKETAPVAWKILSEQVRFRTADGPARKAQFEKRQAEVRFLIRRLTEESSETPDRKEREKLAKRKQEAEVAIGHLEQSIAVVQRAIGGINQPVIDKLEKLLADLGPEASVPALLAGAGETNPAAAQEASSLAMKIGGAKLVPLLIDGLKDEKTFRAASRLLKQATRQDFGDDPKAWADWCEKTKAR